jgi:cell wall-associated NlpC family hydrolase
MSQTTGMTPPLNAFSPWRARTGLLTALVGLALLLTGCSSTPTQSDNGAVSGPVPGLSSDSQSANAGTYHPKRNDLALFAMSLLDTPYSWGGRGPATGFDCSGLISHVYREAAGLPVKGSAADLGQKSRPVDRARIQPGDLLFFNTLGSRHSHVGIYVGGGRFVHASNPRTGVRMDQLSNRYYAQRFEGAGTLLD